MTDDHVIRNRASWDRFAEEFVEPGRKAWASEASWGTWGVPEAEVGMLDDVEGLDAIELGCGTGYVSAWLSRRGARPVGLDNSPVQLANARGFQADFDLRFPLIHGDAERTPFPDERFDYAISEYGAAIWCDPYAWIPEAARILRPGGRLAFLGNSYLCAICSPLDEEAPVDEHLHRDHFGMHRFDWEDDQSTRVPYPARGVDPPAPLQRLRDRGSARAPGARGLHDHVPLGHPRVGPPVAQRGGLESPETPRRLR